MELLAGAKSVNLGKMPGNSKKSNAVQALEFFSAGKLVVQAQRRMWRHLVSEPMITGTHLSFNSGVSSCAVTDKP